MLEMLFFSGESSGKKTEAPTYKSSVVPGAMRDSLKLHTGREGETRTLLLQGVRAGPDIWRKSYFPIEGITLNIYWNVTNLQ